MPGGGMPAGARPGFGGGGFAAAPAPQQYPPYQQPAGQFHPQQPQMHSGGNWQAPPGYAPSPPQGWGAAPGYAPAPPQQQPQCRPAWPQFGGYPGGFSGQPQQQQFGGHPFGSHQYQQPPPSGMRGSGAGTYSGGGMPAPVPAPSQAEILQMTEPQLRAFIRAHNPNADTIDMTHADMLAVAQALA